MMAELRQRPVHTGGAGNLCPAFPNFYTDFPLVGGFPLFRARTMPMPPQVLRKSQCGRQIRPCLQANTADVGACDVESTYHKHLKLLKMTSFPRFLTDRGYGKVHEARQAARLHESIRVTDLQL